MITKKQAINLKYRDTIYSINEKNADGTQVRYRVNGKVKTWKTRPGHFKIPVKHGLYEYGYICHDNAHYYSLTETL